MKHAMAPTSNQEDVLVIFNGVRRLEEIMASSFIYQYGDKVKLELALAGALTGRLAGTASRAEGSTEGSLIRVSVGHARQLA